MAPDRRRGKSLGHASRRAAVDSTAEVHAPSRAPSHEIVEVTGVATRAQMGGNLRSVRVLARLEDGPTTPRSSRVGAMPRFAFRLVNVFAERRAACVFRSAATDPCASAVGWSRWRADRSNWRRERRRAGARIVRSTEGHVAKRRFHDRRRPNIRGLEPRRLIPSESLAPPGGFEPPTVGLEGRTISL